MNLTDEQLEIVNHDYKKNRKLIIEAVAGCVDCQTEFFDGAKWKKISEYEVGDKVTQFNPENRLNELVEPISYIKKEMVGKFRRYENGWMDMVLSKEHNVVVFHKDRFFKVNEEDFYEKMKYNLDNFIPIYFNEDKFTEGFKHPSMFGLSMIKTIEPVGEVKSGDGFKYCFEVPSGMLVMRRNGKIFITSNSGKSSTLYHVCKRNSRMKCLYLVFNKSMMEEAEKKFEPLKNVKVMSIFGLAYSKEGRKYGKRLVGAYKVHDLIDDLHNNKILKLDMGSSLDRDLAYLIKDVYEGYLMSAEHDLRKYCKEYKLEDYEEIVYDALSKLIELARKSNSTIKVTHNFYMKEYAMKDYQIPCDLLLIDEGQDISEIFISITKKQKCRMVVVGDSSQQIYGFAGADNALAKLEDDEARVLTLSKSFRVGHQIGKVCTAIYKRFGIKNFNMIGVNEKQEVVKEFDTREKHAVLCRTRAKLFETAIKAVDCGLDIHFIGGFKSYDFQKLLNAFYFWSMGKKPDPRWDNTFVPFKEWIDVEALLEQQENNPRMKVDPELKYLAGMVKLYNVKIPMYYKQIEESEVSYEKADIILSTAHKSKGLEFECPMYVHEDFIDLTDALEKLYECNKEDREFFMDSIREEMNILYVATTRAKGKCLLSNQTTKFLREMKNINSETVKKKKETEREFNNGKHDLNEVRKIISKHIKEDHPDRIARDILLGDD